MKHFGYILTLLLASLFVGCESEGDGVKGPLASLSEGAQVERITAFFAGPEGTRVDIEESSMKWNEEDCIYVINVNDDGEFVGEVKRYDIDAESIRRDGGEADFVGKGILNLYDYIAVTGSSASKSGDKINVKSILESCDGEGDMIGDSWFMVSDRHVGIDDPTLGFFYEQSIFNITLQVEDGSDDSFEIESVAITTPSDALYTEWEVDSDLDIEQCGTAVDSVGVALTKPVTIDKNNSCKVNIPIYLDASKLSSNQITIAALTTDGKCYYANYNNVSIEPQTLYRRTVNLISGDSQNPSNPNSGSVEGDRAALMDLYNATDGEEWNKNEGWGTTADLGDWYGVETNSAGRVTEIDLQNNFLDGSIPESIGDLTELEYLCFHANSIRGEVPETLGNLSKLKYLYLGSALLSGELPEAIAKLKELRGLFLFMNSFTGSIPESYGENLLLLETLNIENNKISGSVPESLGNMTKMKVLNLGYNELTGSIPESICDMTQLEELHMCYNALSGSIPESIGDLSELKHLDLSKNTLSGTIPESIGELSQLSALCLKRNNFTGVIPEKVLNHPNYESEDWELNPQNDGYGFTTGSAEGDRAVLMDLYTATNGEDWTINSGWGTTEDVGDWYGVTTNSEGRVTKIMLNGNELRGSLPRSLGDLSQLTSLYLHKNNLAGTIPESIGDMSQLSELYLHENVLTGSIPSSLGELSQLEKLNIKSNNLSGAIPASVLLNPNYDTYNWMLDPQNDGYELLATNTSESDRAVLIKFFNKSNGDEWSNNKGWGTSADLDEWHGVVTNSEGRVTAIVLEDNDISGSIPSDIGDLSQLERLDLSENRLSGSIPSSLYDLSNLTDLDLYDNAISGSLSISISRLTNLTTLDLSVNKLSGFIPSTIGDLTELELLYLDDNAFIGSLPASIGGLTELVALSLGYNKLTGSIPTSICDLTKLKLLLLSSNSFTGSIPTAIGNLTELANLSFYSNQLSGTLPESIGELTKLTQLNVQNNNLSGEIPPKVLDNVNYGTEDWLLNPQNFGDGLTTGSSDGDRAALMDLYNATNGEEWYNDDGWGTSQDIGEWRGVTTNSAGRVTEIVLKMNHLVGSLPESIGDLSELEILNFHSNSIVGIPASLGKLSKLQWLYLGNNDLSGELPEAIANLKQLRKLYLFGNSFTGEIPESYCNNLSLLEEFYLSDNNLSGSIPNAIGNLTQLADVSLSGNKFSGTLPESIGKLSKLTDFNIQYNNLSGAIPEEVLNHPNYVSAGWKIDPQNSGYGFDFAESVDRAALMDLYNATDGAEWFDGDGWGTSQDIGVWHGVTTNSEGRVTKIDLSSNNLTGSIPESISDLTELEYLHLPENRLKESIPETIGELSHLIELVLCDNYLSGSIPESIGDLSMLSWINLRENRLSGSIPESIGRLSNMKELSLRDNLLTGSIPESIGDLSQLNLLYLYNNNLSGAIPEKVIDHANFGSEEWKLDPQNEGYGFDPVESAGVRSDRAALVDLYEATNGEDWSNNTNWGTTAALGEWHGVTTNSDGRVTKVELNDNGLSGSIPASIGDLSEVEYISLCKNVLSGSIPEEIGSLSKLTNLYLFINTLSGTIPESIGDLSHLTSLYLNDNILSGSIPESIGEMSQLTTLFLYNNNLSGAIPESVLNNENYLAARWNIDQQNDGYGFDPVESDAVRGDRAALEDLYEYTNGAGWTINTNWGTSVKLDDWYGITTNSEGRVTKITLRNNSLSGAIPESIGDLSELTELYLQENSLSGAIPESIGDLSMLECIYLYRNQLSGYLPESIGRLSLLENLRLFDNALSGTIPESIGGLLELESLWLYNNNLSGAIPDKVLYHANYGTDSWKIDPQNSGYGFDPISDVQSDRKALMSFYTSTNGSSWTDNTNWGTSAELGSWYGVSTDSEGRVTQINFPSNNNLSGSIPESIGDLSKLSFLQINDNSSLGGFIPTSIGDLSELNVLFIQGSVIRGALPESIGNLSKLGSLTICNNNLSGSIPESIGNLSQLESLTLFSNNLSGSIPESIGNLSNLTTLSISGNNLNGSIPESIGRLSKLTQLLLFDNKLSGTIPDCICNLTQMRELYLEANNFTGSIPTAIGNLSQLMTLYLNSNGLSGSLPESIGDLSQLSVFGASYNNLSGSIPQKVLDHPNYGSEDWILDPQNYGYGFDNVNK